MLFPLWSVGNARLVPSLPRFIVLFAAVVFASCLYVKVTGSQTSDIDIPPEDVKLYCQELSRDACELEPLCEAVYGYNACDKDPCPDKVYLKGSKARERCVSRQVYLGCSEHVPHCGPPSLLCAKNDTTGFRLLQGCIASPEYQLRMNSAIDRCCIRDSWAAYLFGLFFLTPMFIAFGVLLLDWWL